MKEKIKNIVPHSVKKIYRKFFPSAQNHGWFGDYSSWVDAEKECTGYDAVNILEKVKESTLKIKMGNAVYERDSVLFDEIQYSQPLLDAFICVAAENSGTLHIVDFGGSLGSSYFQNRSFLKDVKELKWSIVEQPHFVNTGKQFIEDDHLKFYYTIEEALANSGSQVLFISSVLQYFEKPYELIAKCLEYGFEYIIIDRTAFVEGKKERITVQIVPEFIYKASYPAWFFNEQKLVDAFLSKYKQMGEFDSKFDPREKLDDNVWSYRKGFVFKKQ